MAESSPGGLNRLIIQVAKAHRLLAGELLAELGLHPGQEIILMMLLEVGGLSQTQIAERLGVQPPTVTKMLQRMEAAGLVERLGSEEDSRVTLVYPSERGRALEERLSQTWELLEQRTAAALSPDERDTLAGLLAKVRASLLADAEDCG